MADACPCQSGESYQRCCGKYHSGIKPETPEQLMRSRFSAFYLGGKGTSGLGAYLNATQATQDPALNQSVPEQNWLGLQIIATSPAQAEEDAFVEFIAFFLEDNAVKQLHEKSRFQWQNEQWIYVDGEFLPPVKLQRNQACPCGSGKKFKQCHL